MKLDVELKKIIESGKLRNIIDPYFDPHKNVSKFGEFLFEVNGKYEVGFAERGIFEPWIYDKLEHAAAKKLESIFGTYFKYRFADGTVYPRVFPPGWKPEYKFSWE